jgi:PAS domain S-box-containing protein
VDADGIFRYVSPSVTDLTGYAPVDLVGRSALGLVNPAQGASVAVAFVGLVRAHDDRQIKECQIRTMEGESVWVEVVATNCLDEPSVGGVILNFHDISARRRAEGQFARSQSLRAGTQAAAHIGSFDWDMRTNAVSWSDEQFRIFGYEPNAIEVDYDAFISAIHPEDRTRVESDIHLASTTGAPFLTEFRAEHPDGSIRWIRGSGSFSFEGGKPIRLNGKSQDITQQQEVEAALRESVDRLHAVMNNSPIVMFIKDTSGKYLLVNDELLDVLQTTRDEIVGRTAYDFFPQDVAKVAADVDRTVISTLRPIEGEERLPVPEGDARTFASLKFPLLDEDGNCYALCGILTDVTERDSAAGDKARLEAQLRQSQKMEAVGQLAGGVAHDFNNILSVILNYASFLTDDMEPGDPRLADIEQITKAGDRAAKLVRQLLAFSRKEVIQPRVVDLNEVIRDLQELLERSIGEDIELRVEADPRLPFVKADPGRLEQVLLNLVVNARDAMPQGGSLTIATDVQTLVDGERPGLSRGAFVSMSVTDTGSGMDAEIADKVFDPFFTTKKRSEGTGLGLSTVYGIVKQAGGGVYVASSPGLGTAFSVYLPVTTDESQPESDARSGLRTGVPKLPSGKTVLLVEDDATVRELVSRILTRQGFGVVSFSAGSEALEYFRSNCNEIDLMLTDVVMPEMSGKVLSDKLRLIRPDLKTIFMSGYTDETIAQKGVLDDGTQLIFKPFDTAEVVQRINSMLESAPR